ncbi:LOW QUALITY PROTEIN: Pol protein [Phytophthora palmivora]|uniref:Pol protein n=1 Tax=Phytophthora palmivora TaxID=4796 RepID=A0A2P4XGP3_9STRA|nr:LOW QUALITY PROTEIN: Pol protein [Phytophthora palmivora]
MEPSLPCQPWTTRRQMVRRGTSIARLKTLFDASVQKHLGPGGPPMVTFALNNAEHASVGLIPFYLNGPRHPSRAPSPSVQKDSYPHINDGLVLGNWVTDAMALSQAEEKEYSGKRSRGNLNVLKVGELALLDIKNLPLKVVGSVATN